MIKMMAREAVMIDNPGEVVQLLEVPNGYKVFVDGGEISPRLSQEEIEQKVKLLDGGKEVEVFIDRDELADCYTLETLEKWECPRDKTDAFMLGTELLRRLHRRYNPDVREIKDDEERLNQLQTNGRVMLALEIVVKFL